MVENSQTPLYNSIPEIIDACYKHLESNLLEGERWGKKYRFYKPAQTKYGPHQWLWDSGCHMISWSYRNPEFAIADIRSMLQFQQPNGFIPEMIFWGGRKFLEKVASLLGGYSSNQFTDITQMPMLGYSIRAIWNATHDIEIIKEIVPKLVKYYEWWDNERDPDRDGLVSIIHPWESGLDASPLYDPAHGVKNPSYKQLYPNFIKVQIKYKRKLRWDIKKILEIGWFNMEDVGVCAVYADNWGVLGKLAENFDTNLAEKCKRFSKKYSDAIIKKCWDDERNQFVSFYHQGNQEFCSTIETIQSLFPLVLDDLPKSIADKVVSNLINPEKFWLPYPIPSTPKSEETFNPNHNRLMWRGPTWPSTVWIVMEGLLKHGYESIAQEILDRLIEMYKYNGVNEYYNPLTGQGVGEVGLGMSTMIIDMLHRLKRV